MTHGAGQIRAATAADAPRCAEIYAPFVTDGWTSFELTAPDPAEMAGRIESYATTHGWVVAEVGGQIAGYAYGSPHRTRQAYASSADVAVYIDPAFARRGLGRSLYGSLLPWLKDRRFHAAFAGIALPNPGSIALHEAMGFTALGVYREVGWKLGSWRDVGWWQRLL
ncbi:MAG: arsinothricin resistance N-acetyltransferase ArsN1 family B [Novosphingobium sp.]|uniref:arsinothricin resistance N-acetyltransferase ArsN1 family B n=1 Tax=Novosphingobium sp. TaxID=1874826 RepID=UPI0032BA1A29